MRKVWVNFYHTVCDWNAKTFDAPLQCNHYLGTIPLVCIVNQWTVFFKVATLG